MQSEQEFEQELQWTRNMPLYLEGMRFEHPGAYESNRYDEASGSGKNKTRDDEEEEEEKKEEEERKKEDEEDPEEYEEDPKEYDLDT
ncbi:hypothetical protein RYX36_032616 [Vicia faba]